MEHVLDRLLGLTAVAGDGTLASWWSTTESARAALATPIDRAFVGGVLADRAGFAFVSGYQAALAALTGHGDVSALCVTEARGNQPKDIETTLVPRGDHLELSGAKKWATAAPLATSLLVAASTGVDAEGLGG